MVPEIAKRMNVCQHFGVSSRLLINELATSSVETSGICVVRIKVVVNLNDIRYAITVSIKHPIRVLGVFVRAYVILSDSRIKFRIYSSSIVIFYMTKFMSYDPEKSKQATRIRNSIVAQSIARGIQAKHRTWNALIRSVTKKHTNASTMVKRA